MKIDETPVFERYSDHRRAGVGSPNVVMEEPALLGALGPEAGLQVLDLGCGDGSFGRTLLEAGCGTYLGIDGSRRMAAQAQRALQDTGGEVIVGDIEDFAGVPGSS